MRMTHGYRRWLAPLGLPAPAWARRSPRRSPCARARRGMIDHLARATSAGPLRSAPMPVELDPPAAGRPLGRSDRGRGGDRAGVSGTLSRRRGQRPTGSNGETTDSGCEPDAEQAVKDGFYVVQEGDNFSGDRRQDLHLGSDAAASSTRTSTRRRSRRRTASTWSRRSQGARLRLTRSSRSPSRSPCWPRPPPPPAARAAPEPPRDLPAAAWVLVDAADGAGAGGPPGRDRRWRSPRPRS